MISIQPIHINARTFDQRFKPRILCTFEHLQPLFHKNTVLSGQIHHISNRRDRHIFHEVIHVFRISLHHVIKRFDQFICHRRTAQSLKRVLAVRPVRIDHSVRSWQYVFLLSVHFHIWHFMVIRHHDRQSVFFSVSNFLRRSDPVVTCYDRIDPVVDGPVDQVDIQSIPILDPIRNICIHVRPKFSQPLLENVCSIYPVYIIISDHPNTLLLTDFFRQDLYRPVHIFHQHSVIEIRDRSIQIEINSFIPDNIPVADQSRKDRGDVIFLRNLIKIRFLHSDEPFFHI